MEKRKIVTRICALLLATCLIAADSLPVFAAAVAGEPAEGSMQSTKEDFSDGAGAPIEDIGTENLAEPETPSTAEIGPEAPNTTEAEPETPSAAEPEPDLPNAAEAELELLDGTDQRPDLFDGTEAREQQEIPAGIQESNGLVSMDGVPYNGYYMDTAGVLHLVTNGLAEPKTGIVSAGTTYYSSQEAKMLAFQNQTMFVEGKAYTGYFMDTDGLLYLATNGLAEPKTGTVEAGTAYYSSQEAKMLAFQNQTVFVEGKAYTGHFMDTDGLLYLVTNGLAEPKTGTVEAGTAYYSSKELQVITLPNQTLYVEGKVYSGYYLDHENKMHNVKKGTCTLKSGMMKAGAKYYSYNDKKTLSLSKQTLYVEGNVYSGYYMSSGKKMYHVTKGTRTLKTGNIKAGTKYYSYNEGKMLSLSKQTLYVKGKVYTGYYLSRGKKMYRVTKGISALKTGTLKAKTKYYSYHAKKTLTLSKQTLYVKGKVYTGYYLSRGKKMYRVTKGTSALKTGTLKAKTKYYSYHAKKTLTLSKQTLYVQGKVYTGYYMNSKKQMYHANKGTCTLKTGMLEAGTKYYSYSDKKVMVLQGQTLYVEGNPYSGYYMDQEHRMYSINGGTFTPVNTTLNAGTAYYSYPEGKMLTLPAQTVYVNGKAMEGMSPESLATLQRAQAVVASITNDSMAKEEKLRVCFDYVKSAYQESKPRIPHYKGMDWPVIYANDMFVNGTGNCCSYAAAFAYMAKAIGYEEVYACNSGGHGWAEIDGLVYDPEWSKWHHVYNYYALSYDTKTDQDYKGAIGAGYSWMRIKI